MPLITRPRPLVTVLFGLLTAYSAVAATPPGTLLPGQIEKEFQAPPTARERAGGLEIPLQRQTPPPGADETTLLVRKISLEGSTRYGDKELAALFSPLIGQTVTLATLYNVANRITERYRSDGYILSQVFIPPQAIRNGEVVLKAVEGFIARVEIVGSDSRPRPLVEHYAREITRSRPLKAAVLERYMLLINDLPGVGARATLTPSATVYGGADLILDYQRKPWAGGIAIDNRGGEALGPWRAIASIEATGLLRTEDRTGLKLVKTPSPELGYLAIEHERAVGNDGGSLLLQASISRARPDELSFLELGQETDFDIYSLGYHYPIWRSRNENLYLRSTLFAHKGETRIFDTLVTRDELRVIRLGMSYDLLDSLAGTNLFDLEVSRGIDGLGASENGDPLLSRGSGRVDFTKVNLYAARLQQLAPRWSLLGAFSGQYAFDDLLSSELFSFGGQQFGRGYDPSEKVGDHGASAKLELRYANLLPLSTPVPYSLYGFYDVGRVWQRSETDFDDTSLTKSAGLGGRFTLGRQFNLNLEAAKPIDKDVAAEGNRDWRFYATLSANF